MNMKTKLITALIVSAPFAYGAPFIDDFSNSDNIDSGFGAATATATAGVMTLSRTAATGDAGVNWFIDQSTYLSLELSDQQYILEIEPITQISNGTWSPYVLLFDASNTYLDEIQLTGFSSSTSTFVADIADVASAGSYATTPTQYQVRIRAEGLTASGFTFNEIAAVPEPSQFALIGGLLALTSILIVRRKRS